MKNTPILVVVIILLSGCVKSEENQDFPWWEISGVLTYKGEPVKNREVIFEKLERSCPVFCKEESYAIGPFFTNEHGEFRIYGSLQGNYIIRGRYDRDPTCMATVYLDDLESGKRNAELKIDDGNCNLENL